MPGRGRSGTQVSPRPTPGPPRLRLLPWRGRAARDRRGRRRTTRHPDAPTRSARLRSRASAGSMLVQVVEQLPVGDQLLVEPGALLRRQCRCHLDRPVTLRLAHAARIPTSLDLDDQVDDQTGGRRLTPANTSGRSQARDQQLCRCYQGLKTPGTGLEIVCGATHRGFKSHPLRSGTSLVSGWESPPADRSTARQLVGLRPPPSARATKAPELLGARLTAVDELIELEGIDLPGVEPIEPIRTCALAEDVLTGHSGLERANRPEGPCGGPVRRGRSARL